MARYATLRHGTGHVREGPDRRSARHTFRRRPDADALHFPHHTGEAAYVPYDQPRFDTERWSGLSGDVRYLSIEDDRAARGGGLPDV
jgi:hypothetical protein